MHTNLNKWLTPFLICSLVFMNACSGLLTRQSVQTTYYSLNAPQMHTQDERTAKLNKNLPSLIVNTPKATAGFDTRHMMYTRSPHQLERFARNEWVDTPANMLQPLMISSIKKTGQFSAVVPKLGAVKTDFRLESEIVRLVQIFTQKPSVVHFTLRAVIIDTTTGKIIDAREFDEIVTASADNPLGGVNAVNTAVDHALQKLAIFAAESVISTQ